MEYISPECSEGLIVSGHAVDRYTQRVGVAATTTIGETVEHLKGLARNGLAVSGGSGKTYIRCNYDNSMPIWLVLQGRIIKTVLTHQQYLSNVERRIV